MKVTPTVVAWDQAVDDSDANAVSAAAAAVDDEEEGGDVWATMENADSDDEPENATKRQRGKKTRQAADAQK